MSGGFGGYAASPSPGVGVPVCPRHPDRVSYLNCQRCGRPVCTECQRPAPVGVHCVDCVRQAERAAPVRRTVLGGRARAGRPVITIGVIAACVAIHLLQYISFDVYALVYRNLVFVPAISHLEPHRFLTAAFLHGSIMHLAFNMYALWIVGGFLEQMLGRWRYVVLFVLSAIGGSVAYLLFATPGEPSWLAQVVGASGAVFGLFAAITLVLRRTGRNASQIVVLIAINAVLGFVIPNVAWQAHLGGLLTGAALGAVFCYSPQRSRQAWAIAASVLVAVLLVALAVLRYALV